MNSGHIVPASSGTPVRAYVALGANLGDAIATVLRAFDLLAGLPDTRLTGRSSLYRTAPVGVSGQPDYINAVAALDTALAPGKLLADLLELETRHGRTRDFHHAPRTLDLDLLLYADQRLSQPGLELPHPRMHERAFVLVPLAEIAPTLAIPGHGPLAALLPQVADQAIQRIA